MNQHVHVQRADPKVWFSWSVTLVKCSLLLCRHLYLLELFCNESEVCEYSLEHNFVYFEMLLFRCVGRNSLLRGGGVGHQSCFVDFFCLSTQVC